MKRPAPNAESPPPRRRGRHWTAWLLAAGWCLASAAAAPPATEYQVKAVFLFNFVRFGEWPERAFATSRSPFTIGILGNDPFGSILDAAVRGESVGSRPLAVKRFSTMDRAADCHVLFVSRSEQGRVLDLLAALKGAPVLTVSEADRFCQSGGMVRLFMLDGQVKFEINPGAVEAAGLGMSSKVLYLARIVRTENPQPVPQ